MRQLLYDILVNEGCHEIKIASNGIQGVELFKNKEFDLVFTDLGMPGMSGWRVAEEIKKVNGDTPVVLIAGWEVQLGEPELKKSGVDLILGKPFRVSQVLKFVQDELDLRRKGRKVISITQDARKKKSQTHRTRNKDRKQG